MSIGLPDIKLLWGRSGGLCNICKINLSEDKKASGEAYPFGENAHIVAEKEDGPRGKSQLSIEQRNAYPNLILLCPTCHSKIDKAPSDYSIELLHVIKCEHELWFEKSRVSLADKVKQANDYIYARIVDSAATLCMFDEWEAWTSYTVNTSPAWLKQWVDNIEEFHCRIIRAVWPGAIPELENALKSLCFNLTLAFKIFEKHCETHDDWFREVKFYKVYGWNKNYHSDLEKYEKWLKIQRMYIYDATMSANWVAEVVRRQLNPSFFAVPGKFITTCGPDGTGEVISRVAEYTEEQKNAEPASVMAKWKIFCDEARQRERELWGEV